jgi:hypothetical protein
MNIIRRVSPPVSFDLVKVVVLPTKIDRAR